MQVVESEKGARGLVAALSPVGILAPAAFRVRARPASLYHIYYNAAARFTVMLQEALRQAAGMLEKDVSDLDLGEPRFGDARYAPVPFDAARLKGIGEPSAAGTLGFVDGGNLELLHAPDFSVQLVRVCAVLFRGGERVPARRAPQKVEFLCVSRAFPKEGEIFYSAELLPAGKAAGPLLPDREGLVLSSRDGRLASGPFRVDISAVGACARRFAEWRLLEEIVRRELGPGDIAVRDGTLQTAVTNESAPASSAFQAALDGRVTLTALAKTSALFTSSGMSLLAAVGALASGAGNAGRWYYHPLVVNEHPEHRAELFACRLHPASRHVFRFEILREQARSMGADALGRVFSSLASNSADLAFPGYPYGLIEADNLARVKHSEKEALRALLASTLAARGAWERLRGHMGASDAHDILDAL